MAAAASILNISVKEAVADGRGAQDTGRNRTPSRSDPGASTPAPRFAKKLHTSISRVPPRPNLREVLAHREPVLLNTKRPKRQSLRSFLAPSLLSSVLIAMTPPLCATPVTSQQKRPAPIERSTTFFHSAYGFCLQRQSLFIIERGR